ncbi:MAG: M14 family zinc carboxypeptidase [Bacteroidota bacterium]
MPRSALLVAAALLALASALQAQPAPERHSEVRLFLPTDGTPAPDGRSSLQARLAAQGVGIDHARQEETERGLALRTVLSARDVEAARAAGIEVEVLVEDLTAHYLATRSGTCQEGRVVSRIEANLCGSMGGYLTFDNVVRALDSLAARYPDIVSPKVSLGQSWEGRDVWLVEISDAPGVEEDEPEVLYTAVHHAREPGSMMAVLYFMVYLAEQYGTNPEVTDLVDNRRLFFVPVVNPDGYVFNETTNPEGGGFWRKNRRDNGDGSFGVDPNRNYGYQWGYDDLGSSPFTDSQVYRGPAAFSEPEVAAVRDFLEARRITAAFNYHTYSELLLYPWGYTRDEGTPDAETFAALGDTLTQANGYLAGQVSEVLYLANGNSDGWMYGEQTTKPKTFAFTPEVGYSFWPDPADVYPLADENLEANLLLAQLAELPPSVSGEAAPASPGLTLDVTGPNPVRAATGLAFTLAAPADVRLAVYDVLGREVAVLADGAYPAGRHTLRVDASGLAPSLYLVRLSAGRDTAVRRLTVVR